MQRTYRPLLSLLLLATTCIAIMQACTTTPSRSVVAQSGVQDAYRYTSVKKISGRNGVVVSAHPLASAAGLAMLKKGGNAVDAAIATQLALAVVYPGAGNIGGGGFMVARLKNGQTIALDYREMAPAAARRDMYLDANGNAQTELSQRGHLAAGVPGTVAGLFAAMKYAKLPFEELIAPAITLAEKGFAITASEAGALNYHASDFTDYNTQATVFVKPGGWKTGDTLLQTDLANTLKRIRDNGAAGFYEGETARLIVEEMQRGKGIITYTDLKNYTAKERTVMSFTYKGYTILTMPPPSSGGVLLPQLMKMVSDKPLQQYGFHSPEAVQLMVEAERRAYADRATYLGDPDYYRIPLRKLTSDAYCRQRMSDFVPGKAGVSKNVQAGIIAESEETTHLSVTDKEGNAVAVTTTLNGGYGSYTVAGGAGFLLNNEMDDFSIKPGVPNMYGAIGGEANAIAPGKRMLSSMTPTIVLKNNQPFLITGTPGGTTIITSVFQTLINVIEFNMSTEDAVWKPKFHHQWLPDEVFVEKTFPAATREALKKMGYKITERGAIGRTELIKILPDGRYEAVADKRGDDAAEGY
jgi:gamma-glutamyltranspeptidase / glutathione hydrolase